MSGGDDIWAEDPACADDEDGDFAFEAVGECLGDPFLNSLPGFSPSRQWGRKGRGRPSSKHALLPVSQQAAIPRALKTRPPGVEVKRYLEELKNFCATEPKQKNGKPRKLRFGCPKGRLFEPLEGDELESAARDEFDLEQDFFRPCLFDIIQMDASWKEPLDLVDKPKPKLGRPRKYPVKEKVPGRPRGRPRKNPESVGTAIKQVFKPKTDKARMIFTFEDGEANENDIEEMLSMGVLVFSTNSKVERKKLGRPRKHPVKEKVPGRPRGRPRIHPAKEKVPGRPRGRPRQQPRKEKVPGRKRGRPRGPAKEPKEKRPRGRPKIFKPKGIFSFGSGEDGQPSQEQIEELKKQGFQVVDVTKNRRGRKKKVPDEQSDVGAESEVQQQQQEKKKRGRKKKVETEAGEAAAEPSPKKRGRKKKTADSATEGLKTQEASDEVAALPKKRGRKKKTVVGATECEGIQTEGAPAGEVVAVPKEVKKRGRKKKTVENKEDNIKICEVLGECKDRGGEAPPKKKRGRKRKLEIGGGQRPSEKLLVKMDFGNKPAARRNPRPKERTPEKGHNKYEFSIAGVMSGCPSIQKRHLLELSALSPWDQEQEQEVADGAAEGKVSRRRRFSSSSERQLRGGQWRPDGELEFRPEYRDSFCSAVAYEAAKHACASPRPFARRCSSRTKSRTPAAERKLSSCKLDFHSCEDLGAPNNSESSDAYRPWRPDQAARPPLRRLSTTLCLTGERQFESEYALSFGHKFGVEEAMDATPEYRSKFVDFPRQRPVVRKPKESLLLRSEERESPRRRRPDSLQLLERPASVHANFSTPSFDPDVRPEYQDSFKDFPRRRPDVPRPPASLTPEGAWFGRSAEYKASFVEFPRHRPEVRRHVASLRSGGMVDTCVPIKFMNTKKASPTKPPPPGLEFDKSPMDASPEYRDLYRDFPRRRPQVHKPPPGLYTEGDFCDANEYTENYKDSPRMRPKVVKPSSNLMPEGEFISSPEYKENYKDFPRKRPEVKKPPSGLKPEGELMEKSPEYKEAFKDFPRQRPKTPRPSDSLKPEGGVEDLQPEYRTEFVDHPRQRPEVPRPETTLRPRGPWLGRFPEYRAAFIDLPRQRPVTPRPLSHLNSDTLGGGYVPQFADKARASSAGPTGPAGNAGHAHQRSPSPQKRGRSRKKKKSASSADKSEPEKQPQPPQQEQQQQQPETQRQEPAPEPQTSPPRTSNKTLPSDLPPHIKSGEPEKLDPTTPHAYKTRRSPIRIAPSAVSAYRVLEVCGVAPPEGDDADKGREPGDGKWGSGWLARHHSRA
ncbi:Hypothetical predicted protein [Cloeon dipterum]|uniref:Uncharacterized protein n=1 Tax=Cloeon dipterum TaxID=197152 RepID=A0A8S1D9X8_9INSE|nr:Hypothetical predicted protein [Cloeon dipterum]